jgi:hypothetical protein
MKQRTRKSADARKLNSPFPVSPSGGKPGRARGGGFTSRRKQRASPRKRDFKALADIPLARSPFRARAVASNRKNSCRNNHRHGTTS